MSTADRVLQALQPYDLKRQADGSFKSNSPLRQGSNSHAFHLTLADDGEHGAWKDFASDEAGTLYQLARHLGIEPETPITAEARPMSTTKRAYKDAEDYARAHGLTLDALRAARWEPTKRDGRPALRFITDSGPRWRFLDGNGPTYTHGAGYKPCWYRLDEAIALAEQTGRPLVLCNGEISTVTAQYYGVPATCVTSSGERLLSAPHLDHLKSRYTGSIIVALDSDKKGRLAAPRLAKQLREADVRDVVIANLNGHEGFDLADFCTLHEANAAEALQSHATQDGVSTDPVGDQPRDVYPLYDLDGLDALPPTKWLIKGHIAEDSFMMLAGEPGAGKSFLAVDYALRIALAYPDRDVIYIAPEGASGYGKRVRAWLQHHRAERPRNLRFILQTVPLLDSAAVVRLLATLVTLKPVLIVVDTLSRAMAGGDENASTDMGRFIFHCEQVRQATHATILAVHHFNKNGTYRGHSALLGACDVAIEVVDEDGLMTVTNTKTKEDAPFTPLTYRRLVLTLGADVSEGYDNGGDPITSCVIVPASSAVDPVSETLGDRERKVLETIALKAFETSGVKIATLVDMLKFPQSSVYRYVSALLERSLITQGRNDMYYIADKGRRVILTLSQSFPPNSHQIPNAPRPEGSPPPVPPKGGPGGPTAEDPKPALGFGNRENAAPVTRQAFPSVPSTRPAAPTAPAADELPEEPGDLWGEAAPASPRSTPSAAQAERQAVGDAKYNDARREQVRRYCDRQSWDKALAEAGKARGADARRELEALIRFREEEARGGHVVPEGY